MFRKHSPGDPTVVGKMVYDVDSGYPLGILQLAASHPNSGWWITVKVDGPEEFQILHRDRVLTWSPGGEDDTEDQYGVSVIGSPESERRRQAGEQAGASWKDRPGQTGEGDHDPEDPSVFGSEQEAAAANEVVDRPLGTTPVVDPDTGREYTVTPAGGPLGRSHGMALEQVKARLAGVANAMGVHSVTGGRIGGQLGDRGTQMKGLIEGLAEDRGAALRMVHDLRDQKAAAIAATAGHQVNTPTEALAHIDQALAEAERLVTALAYMGERVEAAQSAVTAAAEHAANVSTRCRIAQGILDRYRTSF